MHPDLPNIELGPWIGATNEKLGDYFSWIDEKHFAYQAWSAGEPEKNRQVDSCVAFYNHEWIPSACTEEKAYVCRKSPS